VKFDHVGILVETLAVGRQHLGSLFGITSWTQEFVDPINLVQVQFGQDDSGICYEAISPWGAKSPILRALRSGDRILNHVAYLVPDLSAAAARLVATKCIPTGEAKPAVAYNGQKVQFFVSRLGIIIEIIEAFNHAHVYISGNSTIARKVPCFSPR
jgi:methylmalonyl-CoA/ethylmalonyl-CoA epimerase